MTREKLLQALRGQNPESEPIEIAPGVSVVLRLVPADRVERLRIEARRHVRKIDGVSELSSEEYDEFVAAECMLRIVAEAIQGDLTLDEVRDNLTLPVLRKLWGEYGKLAAVVEPRTDEEFDNLYREVMALVGEDRGRAAEALNSCAYTTLLAFAISSVRPPSS